MCQPLMTGLVRWPLLLLLVLSAWHARSVGAQSQAVHLVFDPATVTVPVGTRQLVRLLVQDVPAPGLAAFQVTLHGDPAVLTIVNPNEAFRAAGIAPFAPLAGNPFCAVIRGMPACPDPAWFLTSTGRNPLGQDTINHTTGRVQLVYGTSGQQAPATGSGVLALLEIVGVAAGTVTIELTEVLLAGNQSIPVPFPVVAGSLQVNVETGGPPNTPPVATGATVTTTEDTPVGVTLQATDADVGDTLSFTIVSGPAHGTLSGTPPDVLYTPAANVHGMESVTFTASDGQDDSKTATVTITVLPVNDAPIAVQQMVTTSEDIALPITLTGNDLETVTANLTYTLGMLPAHGSLQGTPPDVTYTPHMHYNGLDSFTFTVTDRGDPDACGPPGPACTVPLTSSAATVTLTVTPVNDAPMAAPQNITTPEDTAVLISLTGSDIETAGGNLTYTLGTLPVHGSLQGTPPNVTYTPHTNYHGPDSFTFTVTDRGDPDACGTPGPACAAPRASNAATVHLTVLPVNDPPVATAQQVTTPEDTALTITLRATDVDGSDILTFAIIQGPSRGTLSGTPPTIIYTPEPHYHGADSVTFTANDGAVDSPLATVTITITPVNDPPVLEPIGSQLLAEGSLFTLQVTASDPEHDALILSVGNLPQGASFVDHGDGTGTFTWTPTLAQAGNYLVLFRVADTGTPMASADEQVTMTVGDGNQPPVLAPIGAQTGQENQLLTFSLSATDPDASGQLTFSASDVPAGAILTDHGNGHATFTWTPDITQVGNYLIRFTVTDNGVPNASVFADVRITIGDVNRPPVLDRIGDQTVQAGAILLVPITSRDPDQAGLALSHTTLPAFATFTDHGDGTGILRLAPGQTDAGTYPGVVFTVTDHGTPTLATSETFAIIVRPDNMPPGAVDQQVTTDEDVAVAITLTATDVDGDALTFAIVTPPTQGILDGTPPQLTYTPAANFRGIERFTFMANDGTVDSNIATVTIMVMPVNHPPVAQNQIIVTNEDVAAVMTLTATDPDNNALTFAIITGPGHGTLSGTPPDVLYTPAVDFNGTDSFTFTVNDGLVDSNVATVAITITPVNDAPVAADQSVTTTEDMPVTMTLTATDIDGGQPLSFLLVQSPTHGTVSGTPPQVTYTPAAGFHGTDRLTFKANDGLVDSNVATVFMTITPVNHPPVLDPIGALRVREGRPLVVLLTATDPEGDACIITAGNVPPGATLTDHDDCTATFHWTPDFDAAGNYRVLFTVTDTGSPMASDFEDVTITVGNVNQPPVLAPIGAQSAREGEPFSLALTATDPDAGDHLTFSAPRVPAGATLTDHGNGTATFAWLPGFADAGTYRVRFTVTDDGSPTEQDSESVTITVGNVNRPPTLTPVGDQTVRAGDKLRLPVTARDPDRNALTLTVTNSPAFAAFVDHGNGTGILTLRPTQEDAGAYPDVTITATDNGSPHLDVQTTFAITVQGLPPITPRGLKGQVTLLTVSLTWTGAAEATTFQVFRRLQSETEFTALGQTTSRTFMDTLPQGTLFAQYFVVAENAFGVSPASATITVRPPTRR